MTSLLFVVSLMIVFTAHISLGSISPSPPTVKCYNQTEVDELQARVNSQTKEKNTLEACLKHGYNTRGYSYSAAYRNFNDAKEFCESSGGSLPYYNVKTLKERTDVVKVVNHTETRFWVGLERNGSDVWKWLDNTPVNTSTAGWNRNEPNNKDGIEKCVHTNYERKGIQTMNDIPCDFVEPTICEFSCPNNTIIHEKEITYPIKVETCANNSRKSGPIHYLYDAKLRTYQDSVDYCISIGGNIVYREIRTVEGRKFVLRKGLGELNWRNVDKTSRYWIGLTFDTSSNTWKWYDGRIANSTTVGWNDNEPNNLETEHCVHINYMMGPQNFRKINNIWCDSVEPTLCEFDC